MQKDVQLLAREIPQHEVAAFSKPNKQNNKSTLLRGANELQQVRKRVPCTANPKTENLHFQRVRLRQIRNVKGCS